MPRRKSAIVDYLQCCFDLYVIGLVFFIKSLYVASHCAAFAA